MGRCIRILLVSLNVICILAGGAMLAGGLLIQYEPNFQNILRTAANAINNTQLGAISIGLIAVGALVFFVGFVGCCGALSDSKCMLTVYFISILLLFLGQLAIGIAALVYGEQAVTSEIERVFRSLVADYVTIGGSAVSIVDTVQLFFGCCGYNGTQDYRDYNPQTETPNLATNMTTAMATNMTMTMTVTTPAIAMNSTNEFLAGNWPDSCCVTNNGDFVDVMQCHNNALPLSELQTYLNTKGCTASVEAFVKQYLIIIGATVLGIATLEIVMMILACQQRKYLD